MTLAVALLVGAAAALVVAPPASATLSPSGGTVSAGTFSVGGGSLDAVSPGDLNTINIASGRTILDFDSNGFGLAQGESLDFRFAGADDTVLVRVPQGFTTIDGQLNSFVGLTGETPGGNVWVVDPHGVVVGSNAEVSVGGFLGTTADIAHQDFLGGNFRFGNAIAGSQVQIFGDVTGTGTVALVAPSVVQGSNATVITGTRGEVLYGAATGYVLGLGPVAATPGATRLTSFTVPPDSASTHVTPIDLHGNISGGEVLVSAVSSDPRAVTSIAADLTATGAAPDRSGVVVVAAGGQLARGSDGSVQPVPSAESHPHRLQFVDAISTDPDVQAPMGLRTTATGTLALEVPVTATSGAALLKAAGDMTLGSGARLTARSIELSAGGKFSSSAPAGALSTTTPGGRWTIHVDGPSDVTSGPDSGNTALWGVERGGAVTTGAPGNRYVFARPATLTFTSLDAARDLGQSLGDLPVAVTGYQEGVPGLFLGDDESTAFTGSPSRAATGAGPSPSAGVYVIDVGLGDLASLTGYDFAFEDAGRLFVDPTASFASPIDGGGVVNIAKLGRVVPVKVTLRAGGHLITGPSDLPAYLTVGERPCTAAAGADPVESYASTTTSGAGRLLAYDPTAQRWVHNLDTRALPGSAGSCYDVTVFFGGTVEPTSGVPSGGVPAGSFVLQTKR